MEREEIQRDDDDGDDSDDSEGSIERRGKTNEERE